jgi:TonB family protein
VSSDGRPDRQPSRIGRGFLLSALIHWAVLFPLLAAAFILGGREAAMRAEEIDMRFEQVNPEDLPADLPPIETAPKTPEEKKKKKKEALALRAEKPVKPEPEPEVRAPKPEELPPPEKQEEPPPPQPKPERAHEKMVDLDNGKDEEPPPDAKYLAQKNNRAKEETRAERSNLEKQQKGVEGSSPSDRQDTEPGDADNKIAELDNQKSKLGRQAPTLTPHEAQELARQAAERKQSLLSMREAPARHHEITPETVDPSLPRDPEGVRALPEEDLKSMKDIVGRSGKSPQMSLKLSGKQYQYLFGDDAEAAEKFAQKEKSRKQGRFASRMGRIQSALENFIPEVRPGNQTELNTRAAPFAAFIARMHRSIHKLWGFGFLEDLESKPPSSPYNNPNLVSKLELVLNGDGTVDKVTVIQPSGYLPFDVAAIDVAYSAGPYPDPPRAILSGNGKIYVHWTFHRDERQCATSGVDYFILDNAPKGGDKGETAASEGGGEPTRGLPGAEGDPRPKGLKRLEREVSDTPAHRAKMRELDQAAGGAAEPDLETSRRASQQVARADDPAARTLADEWFNALEHADVAGMLKLVAFPFHSQQGVAARGPRELELLLKDLLKEVPPDSKTQALQVYSAGGLRGTLGGLPPGFNEGTGLLFAVGHLAGDTFILVLSPQKKGGWRATGLVRR